DWKGRCIEQWLEQYGSSLLLDNKKTCLGYKSILGNMADRENGYQVDGRRRVLPRCNINIYEEMAIEDLLAHISQTESPKVLQWLKTVILYYVDGKPEEDIASILGMTMYAVKRDKMLGVLRIASRFKIPSYLTD
ncbi:hypothetical protein, partial [uncultured Acinetobacter sp.]|uniref:hypothetical protein n=1 Tax=uncultured Acinetobacter sp. TaxID=165433 RepID=UPI00258B45A1